MRNVTFVRIEIFDLTIRTIVQGGDIRFVGLDGGSFGYAPSESPDIRWGPNTER